MLAYVGLMSGLSSAMLSAPISAHQCPTTPDYTSIGWTDPQNGRKIGPMSTKAQDEPNRTVHNTVNVSKDACKQLNTYAQGWKSEPKHYQNSNWVTECYRTAEQITKKITIFLWAHIRPVLGFCRPFWG